MKYLEAFQLNSILQGAMQSRNQRRRNLIRLVFEELECRRLFSVDVSSVGMGTERGSAESLFALHRITHDSRHSIHNAIHDSSALSLGPIALMEKEPPLATGQNDTQAGAQLLKNFGTGASQIAAIDVSGVLGPLLPAVVSHEDDGSIPLANDTHINLGTDGIAYASGFIGDGPRGSAGTKTGDFDFYKVQATLGQTISADFDSNTHLDTIAAFYDIAGNELEFDDDDGKSFTSFISHTVTVTGTYYLVVGGFTVGTNQTPDNRFDPSSGQGVGTEGDYSVTISTLSPGDIDYYSFDLAKGDIFGASITGNAGTLALYQPDGTLLLSSTNNMNVFGPVDSPLPKGHASIAYAINSPGRYALAVSTGIGAYALQLRDFRTALEQQSVYSHQILFLDHELFPLPPGRLVSRFLASAGGVPQRSEAR